jgi:hypothetical protein
MEKVDSNPDQTDINWKNFRVFTSDQSGNYSGFKKLG